MTATTAATITLDWLAVTALAILIFALGTIAGIVILRLELRRNGWRLRLHVDTDDTKDTKDTKDTRPNPMTT